MSSGCRAFTTAEHKFQDPIDNRSRSGDEGLDLDALVVAALEQLDLLLFVATLPLLLTTPRDRAQTELVAAYLRDHLR